MINASGVCSTSLPGFSNCYIIMLFIMAVWCLYSTFGVCGILVLWCFWYLCVLCKWIEMIVDGSSMAGTVGY